MTDIRSRFASCGDDVVVEPGVEIAHPELWSVGDGVRIGHGTLASDRSRVRLGHGSCFRAYSFIQGTGRLEVGDNVTFYPYSYLSLGDENGRTTIGSDTHFAPGCALYGQYGLTVGHHVNVAAHVVLATVQHDPRDLGVPMSGTGTGAPIELADDVWLGANVSITPGGAVASGSIVGAGAVVTTALTTEKGLYVGVPAKLLRTRAPGERPR
ncbi:acyltransferase [Propionibacteriaceae bacterium Y2011]|uniref:acyltransferase n=1 Tax=Microlunatus sp. Y2014 TaxID=3418488 RepID=UPI003B472E5A